MTVVLSVHLQPDCNLSKMRSSAKPTRFLECLPVIRVFVLMEGSMAVRADYEHIIQCSRYSALSCSRETFLMVNLDAVHRKCAIRRCKIKAANLAQCSVLGQSVPSDSGVALTLRKSELIKLTLLSQKSFALSQHHFGKRCLIRGSGNWSVNEL